MTDHNQSPAYGLSDTVLERAAEAVRESTAFPICHCDDCLEAALDREVPTPSPSLHDRLCEAAKGGVSQNGIHQGTENYHAIHSDDLAAIQAAMIAEATAPLQDALAEMGAEKARIMACWNVDIQRLQQTEEWYEERNNECNTLRAENAALRQAGTEVRNAADKMLGSLETWKAPRSGAEARLETAVMKWDAATTPRAEETHDATQRLDAPRDRAGDVCAGRVSGSDDVVAAPSPTDAAGEGEPAPWETYWIETSKRRAALESRATPADQDPALQARPHKERIDNLVTRCDAATERLDMHMRRIEALGQRAEDADKRLGGHGKRLDQQRDRMFTIERRHPTLRKRVAHNDQVLENQIKACSHRLQAAIARSVTNAVISAWDHLKEIKEAEARTTPQPVAMTLEVTDEIVLAFWTEFWADDIVRSKMDIPDDLAPHIERALRAGLTAALAAAKEAGK